MLLLLIGSRALQARLAEHGASDRILRAVNSDYDVVGRYDDIIAYAKSFGKLESCVPIDKGKKLVIKVGNCTIEAEIAWKGSLAEKLYLLGINDTDGLTRLYMDNKRLIVPTLDTLYMLKLSHRYLRNSPHFHKTMNDIHLLREAGAKLRFTQEEFFKAREAATYDYGHPKLSMLKSDFFSADGVGYVYDHDDIHEAVKHLEQPAYKYFQADGEEVKVSKEKWDLTSTEIKLLAVLEESMVLALERSQIPFPGKLSPYASFAMALEKVCTSITSGWFREFAWENYHTVLKLFKAQEESYVSVFWKAEKEGKVKLHAATAESLKE